MAIDPFLSDLATTAVVALVPVIIGALGYLARQAISLLSARLAAEHFAIVEQLATTIVASVEQTLRGQNGVDKKATALALVRAECAKRGIKLDEDQIVNAIEAAVYRERLVSASK